MSETIRFNSTDLDPYPLQVQGESYHREEIEKVVGYYDEDDGINDDTFWAHLILDDNNKADPGVAVAVRIDGQTVGYLSAPAAKKYRRRLKDLGYGDIIGECRASIKGGFIKRSTGEQADFGIRLDLDLDTFKERPISSPKPAQAATTTKPEPVAAPMSMAEQDQNPILKIWNRLNTRDRIFLAFIVLALISFFLFPMMGNLAGR